MGNQRAEHSEAPSTESASAAAEPSAAALLGVAVLCGLITLWPTRLPVHAVLGDPLGESDNHLWMFWRAVQGGGPLANAPVGVSIPLMDPINLPIFTLLSPLGMPVAWYGMAAWSVGLAMIGGWALSRQLASRQGALVGAVATGCAPFLAGVIDFGITESWPIGWLALHAALLIGHARRGGVWRAAGAGACLGAVALSGWYFALVGLVVEAGLVPWLLIRYRRPGTVLQGLVGLVMVLPSLVAFVSVKSQWSPRWLAPAPGPPGPRPDWASLPIYGTDLLNLILPTLSTVHPSKAVYLGLVVVVLAGVGVVVQRRVAPVLLALPPLLLALGYWPTVAGKAVGFPGPAWLLVTTIPELQGMSHWHRAVAGAVPFLAAAAAIGADCLPRRAFVGPALALLVTADAVALSQTAWPRTTYVPVLPSSLAELEGEGGIVQIPFDNSRSMFSDEPARIYARWQVLHGRMISENYEGVDALLARSVLVAAAHAGCWNKDTLPPYYKPPPHMRAPQLPTDPAQIAAEISALRAWGYRFIVLHRERCRVPARAIPLLDRALGEGMRHRDGDIIWPLADPDASR